MHSAQGLVLMKNFYPKVEGIKEKIINQIQSIPRMAYF